MISGIYYTFDGTHIAFIRVKKIHSQEWKAAYIKKKKSEQLSYITVTIQCARMFYNLSIKQKGTKHYVWFKGVKCQIFHRRRKYQHPGIIFIPGPFSAHWKKLHCFAFPRGHTKKFFPLLGPIFNTVLMIERLPWLQNGKDRSAHYRVKTEGLGSLDAGQKHVQPKPGCIWLAHPVFPATVNLTLENRQKSLVLALEKSLHPVRSISPANLLESHKKLPKCSASLCLQTCLQGFSCFTENN